MRTSPSDRNLRVTLIPPERWLPRRARNRPGLEPVEGLIDRLLLEEHGIEVEVLDPSEFKWLPFMNRHPLYSGLDPMRALRVLLGRRDRDAVISVFESSAVWPLLLRRLFGFKPPIVMWDVAPDETWRPRKMIQNLTLPRIDRVFTLSSAQTPYLQQKWGAGQKARVVWQHVDTEFFSPASAPAPSRGPILAIGDDHGRDWATFLDAVSALDVDVVVKTRHPIDLSVPRRCRIRWIPDRIDYLELRQLYAEASMVVIPLKETLNVSGVGSVLEALSMGKPMIVSRNPPITEYIEDQASGLLTDVGNALQLRATIERLLEDPSLSDKLGRGARERAVSLYSKRAFTNRLAHEIRQVVSSSS